MSEGLSPLVGRHLGGYRLVTELGGGGMGTVFYAEHPRIGRRAAIKVLHPEVARHPDLVVRFESEARAANEIRHPNVVDITDLGHEDGLHFIVMELLEGETLGERIERDGALGEDSVMHIAAQVTSALSAAHEHGIVHRDLKPENIFLTNHPDYPDHAKLLDFGVAKLMGNAARAERTQAGALLGTPEYMSPEQCLGRTDVGAASDVYSLGVVLFQMVTGKLPFPSGSFGEMVVAHATVTPPEPIVMQPALSPRLNDLILRCLEKDAANRWPSMRELRLALIERPAEAAAVPPSAAPTEAGPSRSTAAREAEPVQAKLTQIILERLAGDRLALPSMPGIAVECLEAMKNPSGTFAVVATILERDPLLAARVLRLANSAAFPGRAAASSLSQAIARIGTQGLTVALVSLGLQDAFASRDERIRKSFNAIWEHSLAVALLAKDLVQRTSDSGRDPHTAYLAGLLHDIGKPVVASLLLEAERQLAGREGLRWLDPGVWRQVVAGAHRSVGRQLAASWKLPEAVVASVEDAAHYKHADKLAIGNYVCLANALAKRQGLYVGDTVTADVAKVIAEGCSLLGLSAKVVDAACGDLFGRVGTMVERPSVAARTTASRPRR